MAKSFLVFVLRGKQPAAAHTVSEYQTLPILPGAMFR